METNGKNIIKVLNALQESMSLINEQMIADVLKEMSPEQLELLEEARKATSKEEIKKSVDKLEQLNYKIRNYAT